MSEQAPERGSRREGGGGGIMGALENKIGPLPTWGWIAIIGGGLIAWRVWSSHTANTASADQSSGTSSAETSPSDVPQFVNQTYTTVTAPVQNSAPAAPSAAATPKAGTPVKAGSSSEQLTRNWTAPAGGVSTLAEIAQRLTGTANGTLLHPANSIATTFINGPYKKNHNAKVPKGAEFTYTEGTVTAKT